MDVSSSECSSLKVNPWDIFMGRYQLFCLDTVFMMKLNSFLTFPTCYYVLDCFDRNKTVSQAFFHGIIICDVVRILDAVNDVNIGILVCDVVEHARLLKIAVTFIRSMLALKRPAITILLLMCVSVWNKVNIYVLSKFLVSFMKLSGNPLMTSSAQSFVIEGKLYMVSLRAWL